MKKPIPGVNDLASQNTRLAKEWHPTKNNGVKPNDVFICSNKKAWWICKEGHEWEAKVLNRNSGSNCPYCAGKRISVGVNDLATTNPKLAEDWNYEKNGDLTPTMITAGSQKKMWWKCKNGHEWEAVVANRNRGAGCPFCSGNMILTGHNDFITTNPELKTEWNYEKNKSKNPLMLSPASHEKAWWICPNGHEWEAEISNRCSGNGCPICNGRVLISGENDLVSVNAPFVQEFDITRNGKTLPAQLTMHSGKKVWWKCKNNHRWKSSPHARTEYSNCPFCDSTLCLPGKNDLATIDPKLAKEWHPSRNGSLHPSMVAVGSKQLVWWKCPKGHDWEASIVSRISSQCPYCANRRVRVGQNDLLSQNPDLAQEWHPINNGGLLPSMVTISSAEKVWWLCGQGHEWEASLISRSSGSGCPICSHNRVREGINDLATINPVLAAEWNYEKNAALAPSMFTAGSTKKVWWRCTKGHEWQAVIGSRNTGVGCPFCSGKRMIPGVTDLKTLAPQLVKEWSYEKNGNVIPESVSANSKKLVWWVGRCGHEWEAAIKNRFHGAGCPVCLNLKVVPGENDLASQNSELAKEWHPTKNGTVTPDSVAPMSGKKVWWLCAKGHEWRAAINNRARGDGCPVCAKEDKTSFAEQALYYYLQQVYPDALNGDRSVLDGYELDIYLPSIRTAIEYDGEVWHTDIAKDEKKNRQCQKKGIRLIRIREPLLPYVENCECIYRIDNRTNSSLKQCIAELLKMLNATEEIIIDIDRDGPAIIGNYSSAKKISSLQVKNPELAKQWNYHKNYPLTPEQVTFSSAKRVWWICEKGHEWQAAISYRNCGNNCPYCSGRAVLAGYNDLATLKPKIANQWHPDKNAGLLPSMVTANSGRNIWWCCSAGHEWQQPINNRISDSCPYCSNRRVLLGYNDLATTYPNIAAEWDTTRNSELKPTMVTAKSSKTVYWKCANGHEWKSMISDRIKSPICPRCKNMKK